MKSLSNLNTLNFQPGIGSIVGTYINVEYGDNIQNINVFLGHSQSSDSSLIKGRLVTAAFWVVNNNFNSDTLIINGNSSDAIYCSNITSKTGNANFITINGQTYTFANTLDPDNPLQVDISDYISGADVSPAGVVSALAAALNATADEPNRFVASGMSLEILPTSSGGNITIDTQNLGTAVDGVIRNNGGAWGSIQNGNFTLGSTFTTNTTEMPLMILSRILNMLERGFDTRRAILATFSM